jgi:hypothetical protein
MTQSITEMKREIDRTSLRSGCLERQLEEKNMGVPACLTSVLPFSRMRKTFGEDCNNRSVVEVENERAVSFVR